MVNEKSIKRAKVIIDEARIAGQAAAQARLTELQAAGPRYSVTKGPKTVDSLLDVCGFSWLTIRARGWFYESCKELSSRSYRLSCHKTYRGGGRLDLFDMTNRQELSVNVAANRAAANVLKKHGILAFVKSQID